MDRLQLQLLTANAPADGSMLTVKQMALCAHNSEFTQRLGLATSMQQCIGLHSAYGRQAFAFDITQVASLSLDVITRQLHLKT